jgi:hypothetical protein
VTATNALTVNAEKVVVTTFPVGASQGMKAARTAKNARDLEATACRKRGYAMTIAVVL